MASCNTLPVYGPDNELLYHARIETVPHLLKSGHVVPRGSKQRIRALVAHCGDDLATLLLAMARPKAGTYFSHKGETDTNPPGVWTHRRIRYA